MPAIRQTLSAAGVSVELTKEGRLRAFPTSAVTPEIKNLIAANREAILAELAGGAVAPQVAPMTDAERAAVMAWLDWIGEDYPPIIRDVVEACEVDAEARRYYLGRAEEVPTADATPADDRRSCRQCARLTSSGRCRAPYVEGQDLPIGVTMRADLPRRCLGFSPLADDADQRSARERWPGLR